MRDSAPPSVLAGAYGWTPAVSSWSSTGELLAADVPVVRGRLTVDVEQQVPERLTLTVPEYAGGRSWIPDTPLHPLAQYGQVLDVDITITSAVSRDTWTSRIGRYQIQGWDSDDAGTVRVEAVGLLQIARDDGLPTAPVPRVGGTMASELVRLAPDGLGVNVDSALVDRSVPQSFQWSKNRLESMRSIATAWPARLRVDQYGTVRALPPLPAVPVPVLTYTDGKRGTLIAAPRAGSRDGVFNAVYGTSTATDDPAKAPITAQAEVLSGPLAPATYQRVSREWSTPLATTKPQLQAAVNTMLADSIRPAIRQVIRTAPDPRVEVDDATRAVRAGVARVGYVVAYDMPITMDDGDMVIELGVPGG